MKNYFVFFLMLLVQLVFAQLPNQPKDKLVKDPFFSPKTPTQNAEKVQHIHSDTFGVDANKYEGNPYFSGNVQFSHQGSQLYADIVILYKEQNFIKAIGNVRLQNADASVITAEEMEYDGNTQRGIAKKNVVLSDPKQTIKTETLYYDKISNTAYFNTGGTISDGTNVMYTKSATYYVNTRMIDFTGSVKIDTPEYIVDGTNIKQNQANNTAEFFGATTITNKQNRANKVYTENGSYNMSTKEVWLNKNSVIYYNAKTLRGDKMYFNQLTGFGKATGNVILNEPSQKRFIKGGYGEIYQKKDSAMMSDKAYAVKIFEKDSMYFSAEKILAYQKLENLAKKSFLRAYHQARFFKSNAQARADSISFNETDGILHFNGKPILWSGERQVTGDKIEAYFNTNKEIIDSIKVLGNAYAISKADSLNNKDEFNQIKSRVMTVHYQENQMKDAQAIGNAQAITYGDSQDEKTKKIDRIGIGISTCGLIQALFEERKIQIIECNIGAKSEIYPMSMISREKRFFPDFNWNTKDRLRKWQDIFLNSPNYSEKTYQSDDGLYQKAQQMIEAEHKKNQPKIPKRARK